MANRWIEFVKNYAKEQNISYTCVMCEIKTKNLYKPLKKKEPKIVKIKNSKGISAVSKIEEEVIDDSDKIEIKGKNKELARQQ